MKITVKHDGPRGLARGTFTDENGRACEIQESSLATADAIWLGPANLPGARLLLTREHVRALLPHLRRFVERGL